MSDRIPQKVLVMVADGGTPPRHRCREAVLALAGAFLALAPLQARASPGTCAVSHRVYRTLHHGMTLPAVVARLGCHGRKGVAIKVGDRDRVTYTWPGRGTYGANINLTFTDDRLSDKSQLGLR